MKRTSIVGPFAVLLAVGLFAGQVRGAPITYTESFSTGWANNARIGANPDWDDDNDSVRVRNNAGMPSGWGLTNGNLAFTWRARPFTWASLVDGWGYVSFGMDFQAGPTNRFDDDRMAWSTSGDPTDSSLHFGAQLDTQADGGFATYWRNASGTRVQIPIIAATNASFVSGAWYRALTQITRLTATSARIDVSVVRLDASGNPVPGTMLTGSVADTSALPSAQQPASYYFTGTTYYPLYKNYNPSAAAGNADNVVFTYNVPEPTTLGLLALGGLAALHRRRGT